MADLLTSAPDATGTVGGEPRPLPVGAVLAGAVAAVSVLLGCLAVGVAGWFVSGAADRVGSADALRAGADAWLLGQGSHLDLAAAHITVVPLGLTLLCAWACHRAGRWARRGSATPGWRGGSLAAAAMAGTYGAVAAVTAMVASTSEVHPRPTAAFAGGFVLAFLAGGAGLLSAPDRSLRSRLPEPMAACATGAAASVLLLVVASAVTLTGGLLHGFGAAANVLAGLHVDSVGALLYTVVVAGVAPNAVLLTGGYLLGPGFQVGVGTVVSPTAVSLGPVPAFPLLAAMPGEGPTPWWTLLLMGVPVLAAAAAAVLMLRRHPVRGYEIGALRGLATGIGGGVAFSVLATVASGSVGPDRMSEVGVGLLEVLPAAVLSLGLGGVLGGLLGTWWERRRA